MKAVIYQGPGRIAVEDRPEPRIEQAGDAIVRVSTAGICGSDVVAYRGFNPVARTVNTITGHEIVGVVSAVGDSVRLVAVGTRVVSPFSIWCGGCFYCKQGLLSACEKRQVFGNQLPGGHAEYVRVPNADATLETLPDGLSDEKAIFLTHPLTGVYAGLQMAKLNAGDSIAILGCGATGLCAVAVARSMGAGQIFATDHHEDRLKRAEAAGAVPLRGSSEDVRSAVLNATGGRGADIAVEATGTATAVSQAVNLVRPWGTLLSLGYGIEGEASFPIGRLAIRRMRLLPTYAPAVKNYMSPVLKMLINGIIDPAPFVSHTLPLSDAPRAYEMMARRSDGAIKVLLKP